MDTLQAMRAFVRVIDSGSFTAAAQSLNLSNAQVSRLVSDLETSLRARLLHRTTRRLALTEAGERYLQRCRLILAEVHEAAVEASGAHLTPRGRLRVHSVTSLGTLQLAPLVGRYSERYPEVTLELTLSQRVPDLIEEGHDVVITACRDLPDSELVAQRLAELYNVVCAAPAYLERHGTPQRPEDLQAHRCLRLIDPLFSDRWVFQDGDEELIVRPGDTFQVNVAEAMAHAAESGMGICLLPSFVAARAMSRGGLKRLLPSYQIHQRSIFALYPSRSFLDAKTKTWIEFLKEELPKVAEQDQRILDDPAYWA
ncbi:LysR family transcriptional regulator [Azotobacter bryophylli]|uniref:LysR family transcriptional regulator n=1 Tax=Azotobacter bryophylli TaxID=1986537 RepID=A0ABV7APC0_9GAMM